jgi:NAD kinase
VSEAKKRGPRGPYTPSQRKRYDLQKLADFEKYYKPSLIERIRTDALNIHSRPRRDVYAVFEHKNNIYIRRSDLITVSDADEALRWFKKQEPKGKFIIMTELAALNASLPFYGDLKK